MMKIRSRVASLLLVAVLATGCSALSTLSSFVGDGDSYSVEAQIGDDDTQIGNRETLTTKSGDIIKKETTINEGPSPWYTLLLILGWVLPSPRQMWLGLQKLSKVRMK